MKATIVHASNWKKKPLEVFKRIKYFINVMGDKFAMSFSKEN